MINPLLEPFSGPFGLPPFDRIEPSHFLPAFEQAMADHRAEIEAIAQNPASPDFVNTIEALERAGGTLDRVASVFFTLAGGDATDDIQAIDREISPKLAQHGSSILLDARLWSRVRAVVEHTETLDPEPARVTELYRRMFVRAGAALDEAARGRMAEIQKRLAELGTAFGQAVLKDEQGWVLALGDEDRAGLPDLLVEQAEREGRRRGMETAAITLSRSSVEPFLAFSERRDLREKAWRAWTGRGEMHGAGTWPIIDETLSLRAEKARLLDFESFAAFKLETAMAKTPERVRDLLMRVFQPARTKAEADREALQALAAAGGTNIEIEGWDWRFYAERRRRILHDLDEAAIKPYLSLDSVIQAAFDVAHRLFGLRFEPVEGLTLPHTDARAWKVSRDGAHVGLFVGDYFARPTKRSGAWASGLRRQQKLSDPQRPIIMNTMNFGEGEPSLLSFDDARTLFHEFGHALHGLLSDVTYPLISGTSVARDFVELPSQLYEHWLSVPEILERHALHHETGQPMPVDLVQKVKAAETYNQGYLTCEYLGSALVDLAMHEIADGETVDGQALEADVLARIGMPCAVAMRHRSPHFLHVFAGDGYAAGYYSYMWSEVLDADAFRAFEETGSVFDGETARKLETHVLAAGGRQEPDEAYVAFRGRLPGVEALLEGRGLSEVDEPA
ncbi:MAG: M3 family metallopeptidase [Pseudomonadota bacterium]